MAGLSLARQVSIPSSGIRDLGMIGMTLPILLLAGLRLQDLLGLRKRECSLPQRLVMRDSRRTTIQVLPCVFEDTDIFVAKPFLHLKSCTGENTRLVLQSR